MGYRQLPQNVARELNSAWYALQQERKKRGIPSFPDKKRDYVVIIPKVFPQERVYAEQRKNDRVHLPRKGLALARHGEIFAQRVMYYCGQATNGPVFTPVREGENLCLVCVAKRTLESHSVTL